MIFNHPSRKLRKVIYKWMHLGGEQQLIAKEKEESTRGARVWLAS